MPDSRRHRGPHQADAELFAPAALPALRKAAAELSWLLSRGYKDVSALKLVGDRHLLKHRQRVAVRRCSCSADAKRARARRRLSCARGALRGSTVLVDGFNCLVTLEALYSGGVILRGRDGAHRDLSSVHGSYRRVEETRVAARAIGRILERAGAAAVHWLLDRPVSNSGRLRSLLRSEADGAGWPWTFELTDGVDRALVAREGVVATGDSWILDRAAASIDLPAAVLRLDRGDAWVVDLSGGRA